VFLRDGILKVVLKFTACPECSADVLKFLSMWCISAPVSH